MSFWPGRAFKISNHTSHTSKLNECRERHSEYCKTCDEFVAPRINQPALWSWHDMLSFGVRLDETCVIVSGFISWDWRAPKHQHCLDLHEVLKSSCENFSSTRGRYRAPHLQALSSEDAEETMAGMRLHARLPSLQRVRYVLLSSRADFHGLFGGTGFLPRLVAFLFLSVVP